MATPPPPRKSSQHSAHEWALTPEPLKVSDEAVIPEYLTLRQLARYANVSERQLRNYLNLPPSQALPCYRPGRKVLVRQSEFDAWFAQYRSRSKPVITRLLRELDLDPERLPEFRSSRNGRG